MGRPPGAAFHQPVMVEEVVRALQVREGGRYVDATVGTGGHAQAILEAAPRVRLLGLDVDPDALALARERLAPYGDRVVLRRASYTRLPTELARLGWEKVDGIVADLGVSSLQLDRPDRGFSFREAGPLDMRFDPEAPVTAAQLVNTLTEEALAEIFWKYGEERHARRIARAIVRARPLHTTRELADLVARVVPFQRPGFHPATRVFQALRIAVNRELENLERFLPLAIEALKPGGRLAVIAFHSLEDRIVKHVFKEEARGCVCPPSVPVCQCGRTPRVRIVKPFPMRPSEEEVRRNPRARSARLRVVERL